MPVQVQALRSIEPYLGLEKLYVLGTNCTDNGPRKVRLAPCSCTTAAVVGCLPGSMPGVGDAPCQLCKQRAGAACCCSDAAALHPRCCPHLTPPASLP